MPFQGGELSSLSLAIGAIVLLLWCALWALRRARPTATSWSGRDCSVVRSLSLGPRERLVVVCVGTKQLVIGVGSAAISLLCELDEPLSPNTPASAKFSEAFRKAVRRWHGE
jgi:flagellar protein FliO/FliZ